MPHHGDHPTHRPHLHLPRHAPHLPPLAVVDIDGVVADVRHRLHHVELRPKNWHAFFAAAHLDPALTHGVEVVRGVLAEGLHVHWLTGRPEYLREVTEHWLERHGLPSGPLSMRPSHDRRPARVFKHGRLEDLSRSWDVRVVIDDDPSVVSILTDAGYPVMHAEWMGREKAEDGTDILEAAQEDEGRT